MIFEIATGIAGVAEAVEWIANGYPLEEDVDQHALLAALSRVDPRTPHHEKALQRLTRELTRSDVDSAAILLAAEQIPAAVRFRTCLDLMPAVVGETTSGWATIERYRSEGVSYELLLAQRVVGGTWLAHRNQTSSLVNHAIAARVEEMLRTRGLTVLRSTACGGETPPKRMQEVANCDRQVGILIIRASAAGYGIVFATARDQGSARSSGARLQRMARPANLPFALVLTGRGWSSRNETADLALSFQGRLYTERTLEVLVEDVLSATNVRTIGGEDS